MTTRITPGVGANLLGQHSAERNQDATAYVGNLDPRITEEMLWELFVQAGPVINVYVPKDRVTGQHQGYGFVEFRSEEDADYAIKIINMIKLHGKPVRVNKASQDRKQLDVGANLFIGNLDPDVDEKLLYDTFSAFGQVVGNPKIMRDPETGNSRGFGFVSYDTFDASDAAIDSMSSQYLCNRAISVSYAYKKDTKGERHGSEAERQLASSNPSIVRNRPHTMFAEGPPIPGHPLLLPQDLLLPALANGHLSLPFPFPLLSAYQSQQGPPPPAPPGPSAVPQQTPSPWGMPPPAPPNHFLQRPGMPPPPPPGYQGYQGGPPGRGPPPPPPGYRGPPPPGYRPPPPPGQHAQGPPPGPWNRPPPPQSMHNYGQQQMRPPPPPS